MNNNRTNRQNYSECPTTSSSSTTVPKIRKQVKKACLNCRKSHTACSEERPCTRCKELGIADICRDAESKKRGRKQASKNDTVNNNNNNKNTQNNNVKRFVFVDGMNQNNLPTTSIDDSNNLTFINHHLQIPQSQNHSKKVKMNNNDNTTTNKYENLIAPQNSLNPLLKDNYDSNIINNIVIDSFEPINNLTNESTIVVSNKVIATTIKNNNILNDTPQIFNNTNLNLNFDTSSLIDLLIRYTNNLNQSTSDSVNHFIPNIGMLPDNILNINDILTIAYGQQQQQQLYFNNYENVNNNIHASFSIHQQDFNSFNDMSATPPTTSVSNSDYYEDPYLTIAKLKAENETLKLKYENVCKTSEEFTLSLLGHNTGSNQGIVIASNRGRILVMNKVMFDTLEYPIDAVEKGVIKVWKDIIHPINVSSVLSKYAENVKQKNKLQGFDDCYLLRKKNGGIVQANSKYFISYDNKTEEALFSISYLTLSEVPMISNDNFVNNDNFVESIRSSNNKSTVFPFVQESAVGQNSSVNYNNYKNENINQNDNFFLGNKL
ncbi:hypothetical protein ABK040_005639 [Willaertia magna]